MLFSRLKNLFQRKHDPTTFDLEKAVGHYLLTLPRCTGRVLVVSRRYLDKRYNFELTVDTASLTVYAKGVWTSYEQEQAARLTIPLWLRLGNLSDNTVTLAPKEFFDIWRAYHSIFYEIPGSKIHCHECGNAIDKVSMVNTHLAPTDIYDNWRYEWFCPQGHLLYQEEIGRHPSRGRFPT